jgi:hypothetical protein
MSDESERDRGDAPDGPIEAIDFSFRTDTAHGAGSGQTRLVVAGQDLTRYCRRCAFTADVHSLNTVELELYARQGFELVAPVSVVYVAVYAVPGYRLVQQGAGDRVIYHVEAEDA